MRTVLTHAARGAAAVLLAGLLASAVRAADPRFAPVASAPATGPEVHKMVIQNGPSQTVHYFSTNLSFSDQAALRDLERTENEANYADNLQELRRQYVASELALNPQRTYMQQHLYGTSITRSYEDSLVGAAYGPDYYPWGGLAHNAGFGYPYGYGYGYGYGNGYGSAFAGSSATINQSLANGVGDEGRLKEALAPVIASQASAEYATSAGRALASAQNRVGDSEAMRTALGVKPHGVGYADFEPQSVTLTLKAGGPIDGTIVDEDGDWISVETATDQVSVRKADVTRIDRHKSKSK